MMRQQCLLALVALAVVATACKKKEDEGEPLAVAPSASEAAPAPVRPAEPAPPDLDAQDLLEDLKCGEKAKGVICRVLGEFAEGKEWQPRIPSGRGVWVGRSYSLTEPADEGELIALRAKQVPTAQVGPSDLPLMIGFELLPEEHHAAGEKLVRALDRGGQGKLTNPALPFLEERFIPRNEFGAMQTEGKSTKFLANDDVYVRSVSLKKIILVSLQAAKPGSDDIEGEVAEMWSAVW